MKITKLRIKNLFGISSYEQNGSSVELTGNNGTGKTSVIDAIRYALTSKSSRDYVIRQGESEGEILVETDSGLMINRRARQEQADYKAIKQHGRDIPSPESFLRNEIFTELQLNPVEFLGMSKNEQNRIILDMIQFEWDLNWIKEQFGELVPGINYEQNILSVLHDIQAENGHYFMARQDINRDARNKKAFITEIAETLPAGYKAEQWRNASLKDVYTQIETIRQKNDRIEKAKRIIENKDNKVRAFQADREIAVSVIERETNTERERLEKENIRLQQQIKENVSRLSALETEKVTKIKSADQDYQVRVAEFEAQVKEYADVAGQKPQDLTELTQQAQTTENMKALIHEYDRMIGLQADVERLQQEAEDLTSKIEKARALPGEILETANIPISGLTVKDGMPLINGLPVSNLSEGEKLDLCVDIATRNESGLNILLIDGAEKLSDKNRKTLYTKLKKNGVQFIATRTTDDADLLVTEL